MPRHPMPLYKEEFQKVVADLENAKTFATRQELWGAVEQTDYAKSMGLRAAYAGVKAKEMGIEIKTPTGKRGAALRAFKATGIKPARRGKRPLPENIVAKLYKSTPKSYHFLVAKIAEGSLKAMVHRNCLQCTCWSRREVAKCTIESCSFFCKRPYVMKNGEVEQDPAMEETNEGMVCEVPQQQRVELPQV